MLDEMWVQNNLIQIVVAYTSSAVTYLKTAFWVVLIFAWLPTLDEVKPQILLVKKRCG
jgi:hypothetical protein